MYLKTRDLPQPIQAALNTVGYGRPDIQIVPVQTISAASASGDGCKAFIVLVDAATGRTETKWGSWGGANMFNPGNAVDMDTAERPMPPNGLVIRGSKGGARPVYAEIECHPQHSLIAKALAAPKAALTREDKVVLECLCGLKSFARQEEAERCGVNATQYQASIAALCLLGYAKANKAGAVSVTTEGRNARPTTYAEKTGKEI